MDVRLRAVAQLIRSTVHVDVGSDHGLLLVSLLKSGRIKQGIAIENKRQPYGNSCLALAGLEADVRFGNGLAELASGEADSLSICGMGAESIVKILDAFPDRVPREVVLQPNRQANLVRSWALRSRFHVSDELIARGHWPYEIMSFVKANQDPAPLPDPAYEGLDREAALIFGPLILRRRESSFVDQLRMERKYLSGFSRLKPYGAKRLALIENVLDARTIDPNANEVDYSTGACQGVTPPR